MNLSPRDKRALTILIAAVAAILVVRYAILPALDSATDAGPAIRTREKMLRKYQLVAAAVPAQEMATGSLANAVTEAEKGLLTGATPALQAAEVQQQVRDLALGAGIQMRSIEFLPGKKASAEYAMVGVSAQFTAPVDQLVAFLTALQNSPRVFVVDTLHINAANVAGSASIPAKKLVSVRVVIFGLAHAEADSSK